MRLVRLPRALSALRLGREQMRPFADMPLATDREYLAWLHVHRAFAEPLGLDRRQSVPGERSLAADQAARPLRHHRRLRGNEFTHGERYHIGRVQIPGDDRAIRRLRSAELTH